MKRFESGHKFMRFLGAPAVVEEAQIAKRQGEVISDALQNPDGVSSRELEAFLRLIRSADDSTEDTEWDARTNSANVHSSRGTPSEK